METDAHISGVEELRLIEWDQRSVSMRIIGRWLEIFWVEMAQEHHSRLIIALDHKRWLMLAAASYRKLALPGEPIDWHLVISRCLVLVSVKPTFFGIEHAARHSFGDIAKKALPYDLRYKGLLEILADKEGTMCGFRVHWPNGSDSTYRRTEDGIEMVNCMLAMQQNTIEFMVGMYARKPGTFSPLVEEDARPVYTKREGDDAPLSWPGDGSV